MSSRLPPKKDVALTLLERSSVFIHLDPRVDTVRVPPWFRKQPQLVLQVGLNMAVAIPDLNIDDEGISCTLSFNRSPFYCVIPWGCVYALVGEDSRGMVWPDDVPPEVAAQNAAREKQNESAARVQEARSKLRAVAPASEAASADAAAADPPAPSSPPPAPVPLTAAPPLPPAPAEDSPAPADAAADAEGEQPAARPSKRPLPPYLRIVK